MDPRAGTGTVPAGPGPRPRVAPDEQGGEPGAIDPTDRSGRGVDVPPPTSPSSAAQRTGAWTGAARVEQAGSEDLLLELAGLPAGDPRRARVREELTRRHLPLAEHLAARFLGRGEPHDDLVQVATIGLLKSLDRFDPARGVPFGAFAVPTMLGEIKRHFRDRGWAMRVPRRVQEIGRALTSVRETLTHELGRAPTVAELAERTGWDTDDVVEAMESANAYTTLPLDTGSPTSPVAALGSLDDRLENVENREALRPLLAGLAPRERRILALRFVRGMSQAQIAQEVGISQMHVSRLLTRTLGRLREGLDER